MTFSGKLETQLISWMDQNYGVENYHPGFDRLIPFLAKIKEDLSRRDVKIITIGGTNGKGETAHIVSDLMQASGVDHALWISPHISTICERISYNQELISQEDFLQLFQSVQDKADKLKTPPLSYYEFLFVCFLEHIKDRPLKYLLLEVGLGGRLDATNYLDSDLAVITSISRDHQQYLGNSLASILSEKLQIARSEKLLITALELEYCRNRTYKFCRENNIQWEDLFAKGDLAKESHFSKRNLLLAHTIWQTLQNDFKVTKVELSQIEDREFYSMRGRLQKIDHNKNSIYFSGTHNIDGFRKLMQFLDSSIESFVGDKQIDHLLLSLSNRSQKDVETILKIIKINSAHFKKITITQFHAAKAIKWDQVWLERFLQQIDLDCTFCNRWQLFLEERSSDKCSILITGSNYLVGDVQSYLS